MEQYQAADARADTGADAAPEDPGLAELGLHTEEVEVELDFRSRFLAWVLGLSGFGIFVGAAAAVVAVVLTAIAVFSFPIAMWLDSLGD